MNRLLLAIALSASALSGCAQLNEPNAEAGATSTEPLRPYPSVYRNDHYYVP